MRSWVAPCLTCRTLTLPPFSMNAKMLSINSIASTPYSADPLVTRSLSALCNNACRLLVENVDDLLRSAVHNGVQQNRRNSD